jgi:hypothetical protein
MYPARLLEKVISWLVLIGFLVFCVGYVFLLLLTLHGCDIPFQLWIALLGLVLVFLSLFGLKLFRRFFFAER